LPELTAYYERFDTLVTPLSPMKKNWIRGRQGSGELANGSEAHIHQGH